MANKTRDELIDARDFRSAKGMGSQEKDWKPIMEVDMDGIPHAFCISEYHFPNCVLFCSTDIVLMTNLPSEHSEFVAEKVTPWIEQIVDENCRENSL